MATKRGPRQLAPVNTLLTMGVRPEEIAQLPASERAKLLKRMKGTMPANGTAPAPASGVPSAGGASTLFSDGA